MKLNIRSYVAFALIAASMLALGGCNKKEEAETTAAIETTVLEERIEKKYDEHGIITNEYCYVGDELKYSIDYLYETNTGTVRKIKFEGKLDENGNSVLIESERFEVNELGELKYYCKKDRKDVLVTETTYSFYDDLTTVWTEIKKDYDGKGGFTAEKKVYSEEGKLTDLYTYDGNTEKSHTVYTYDENGNRTETVK